MGLINSDVSVNAITGSTGAGQKPGTTTHFSWRNNNMSIYKAFNHQHVPEIRQSLKQTQGYLDAAIDFIPYRGDFARGIFATEVVKTDKPIEEIVAGYKEFYKNAKFTRSDSVRRPIRFRSPPDQIPSTVRSDCVRER